MEDLRQLPEGDLAELLDAVAQMAPVPTLITDREGRFLAANQPWRDLGGVETDLVSRRSSHDWMASVDPGSRLKLTQEMDACAETGRSASLDLELDGPNGRRWSRWWVHRRVIESTPVLVLVTLDVHDDVCQRDDLHQLATRDDLTGLVNRRVFLETVEQALRRTERFGEPAGLLYVDLDSFKAVNDRAGHVVGDRVLAAVAARLRQAVRGVDVVGRVGGDEFAVLIERLTSPGEAAVVARRMQEALCGSVEVDGERWSVSASVGIAITQGDEETAIELLARADAAMYAAKRARGRADEPALARATLGAERSGGAGGTSRATTSTRTAPSAPVAPSETNHTRPTITAADLRLLREGMDTIRQSLEHLLEGLAGED